MRTRLGCTLVAFAPLLSIGCSGGRAKPAPPIALIDRLATAESTFDDQQFRSVRKDTSLASRVVLSEETRASFTPPLPSRFAFAVRVPSKPVFRFAIAASHLGEPEHWPPVEFRVVADVDGEEQTLFEESLNRGQAGQWFDREIDLTPWEGRKLKLVLQTRVAGGERRARRAARRMMPVWGYPVLASREYRDTRPNVVLISIDTLRADHLGAYGYHRDTSPHLDALARDATVFEAASSVSAWTLPTHLSMLTGLLPSLHGVRENRRLDPSVPFLPELLSEAGYRNDGVASWYFLSQTFGFDRGFHSYRLRVAQDAEHAIDTAIELIRRAEGQKQFLFVHLIDPHWPYLPPSEWLDRFGKAKDASGMLNIVVNRIPPRGADDIEDAKRLYDAEIAYTDAQLERLFSELESRGLYDDSLIIVTADHGEAFYEHDHWTHMVSLYDEMTHIPLIVKWPGGARKGRVSTPVSQTDVFPTILEAAGVPVPPTMAATLSELEETAAGRSILSELTSEIGYRRSCTDRSLTDCVTLAVRVGNMKYITTLSGDADGRRTAVEELYDLADDPGERRDLSDDARTQSEAFSARVRAFLRVAKAWNARTEDVVLDESVTEQLRSLGYIE